MTPAVLLNGELNRGCPEGLRRSSTVHVSQSQNLAKTLLKFFLRDSEKFFTPLGEKSPS